MSKELMPGIADIKTAKSVIDAAKGAVELGQYQSFAFNVADASINDGDPLGVSVTAWRGVYMFGGGRGAYRRVVGDLLRNNQRDYVSAAVLQSGRPTFELSTVRVMAKVTENNGHSFASQRFNLLARLTGGDTTYSLLSDVLTSMQQYKLNSRGALEELGVAYPLLLTGRRAGRIIENPEPQNDVMGIGTLVAGLLTGDIKPALSLPFSADKTQATGPITIYPAMPTFVR